MHSQWQPTDLDFAVQPSGHALQDEDGNVFELSNGQYLGLMADLSEDAAAKAERALSRIEAREASRDLDLSNTDDGEPEVDADDIALARWDAEQ